MASGAGKVVPSRISGSHSRRSSTPSAANAAVTRAAAAAY
jgi:hypothetical protein